MIKKVEVKQTLPVSLLDELRSEEIKKRINSVSQLKTIATALGPDRTRNELVPFLNGIGLNDIEFVDDDEQVLVLLINTLKDFGAMIGGDHHEKCLIPLLISFCRSDEKTASEAATEAMISIMRRMDLKKSEDFIIETIRKMVESDSMRGKESGISLLATMIR
jgi:serine/threonine-protein phosphatase 2A regulatory subunit A